MRHCRVVNADKVYKAAVFFEQHRFVVQHRNAVFRKPFFYLRIFLKTRFVISGRKIYRRNIPYALNKIHCAVNIRVPGVDKITR